MPVLRIRIRDPVPFLIRDPGWRQFGSMIRDKHPGSATQLNGHIHQYLARGPHPKLITVSVPYGSCSYGKKILFLDGTPTKRQVSKRQISKRLVLKRPVFKFDILIKQKVFVFVIFTYY